MRCFREFVRDVSAARRLRDTVPSMSVIADTQQLIGNCGYGGLIMDQSKHRHVTYVNGANAASLLGSEQSSVYGSDGIAGRSV